MVKDFKVVMAYPVLHRFLPREGTPQSQTSKVGNPVSLHLTGNKDRRSLGNDRSEYF